MKILFTGFDPFGGEEINPSWEAVKLLPDRIAGAEIVKLCVPTVFGEAFRAAGACAARERADAVICVGQAGGRAAVTVERVAINLMDARMPDNAGYMPSDEPVVPGGPAAYFATAPVKAMTEAMRAAGVSAEVSYSAGTFVCNSLLYSLLHALRVPSGFIHLPYTPRQAAGKTPVPPSLALERSVLALRAAAEAAAGELERAKI